MMAPTSNIVGLAVIVTLCVSLCGGVVLCPDFPSCCFDKGPRGYGSCHILCPTCAEATEFTNGIRNRLHHEKFTYANEELKHRLEELPDTFFFRNYDEFFHFLIHDEGHGHGSGEKGHGSGEKGHGKGGGKGGHH